MAKRRLVVEGKEYWCHASDFGHCLPTCSHKFHISCTLFRVSLKRLKCSWTFERLPQCLEAERKAGTR